MITYEWCASLSKGQLDEVAALLNRAAEHDNASEYSSIDYAAVASDFAGRRSDVKYLLIWLLPETFGATSTDHSQRIAGVLRIELAQEHDGTAQFVIDPELRSRGLATLFVEQAGLDVHAADGWLESGIGRVTAWARGNHPAASRLSDRFLIPRTKKIWKLIYQLADGLPEHRSPIEFSTLTGTGDPRFAAIREFEVRQHRSLEEIANQVNNSDKRVIAAISHGSVLAAAVIDLRPVLAVDVGKCVTLQSISRDESTSDPTLLRGLIVAALAVAQKAGFDGLCLYADSQDTESVHVYRLLGFQVHRTDVQYEL